MAKKKSIGKETVETVNDAVTKEEKEFIVLNNNDDPNTEETEEEEIEILETREEDDDSIVIDTKYLDEEIAIGDIFKEGKIDIIPIGKQDNDDEKEKKASKEEKHNKHDKENKQEKNKNKNEKELSKAVLEAFTMILKGEDFEPIPYPFGDNQEVFNLAFEEITMAVDHMAVSRFIKKNPDISLKDAFRQIFTIPDNEIIRIDVQRDKPTKEVIEEIDEDDNKVFETLTEEFEKQIELTLLKVVKEGDKEPEVVARVLEEASAELDATPLGKLVNAITNKSVSDIIRAEINGDKTLMNQIEESLAEASAKIQKSLDKNRVSYNEISMDKFIEIIINDLKPDITNMSLYEMIAARDTIAPDMSDEEFTKYIMSVRNADKGTEKESEEPKEQIKEVVGPIVEEINNEEYLDDDEKYKETSSKFYAALSNIENMIFGRSGINKAVI